jgi:arylsulfatase A-like enzyme
VFSPWGGTNKSPALEGLCREGISYSQAISQAPWTLPSMASIFSGLLPTEHGITGDRIQRVQGRPSSPESWVKSFSGPWLPEALRERGFRTWGATCNAWVSTWSGFHRGFEEFVDIPRRGVVKTGTGRALRRLRNMHLFGMNDKGGREVLRQFRSWLAGQDDHAPWFAFVNLMEVHSPYDPPLRFHPLFDRLDRRRRGGSVLRLPFYQFLQGPLRERPSEKYLSGIRSLYDKCGQYADWLVGEFERAVRDHNEPTIIVVVSDHGENLGEHGLFGHHSSLHETLLRVPLVVAGHKYALGQGRVDKPVSLQRLADWLLGLADGNGKLIEPNGPIISEYESTARHTRTPYEFRKQIEQGDTSGLPPLMYQPGISVRNGDLKYVATEDGAGSLYDLAADPGEESDVFDQHPVAVRELTGLVDAWRQRRADQGPISGAKNIAEDEIAIAEDEIAEHLRALGYIE